MKNTLKILFLSSMLLVSCGGSSSNKTNSSSSNVSTETPKPSSSSHVKVKQDFTGITFADKTVTFDGYEHTIDVEGVPTFASVEYENKGPHINAGEYTIKATVSALDYNDLVLNAKLNIVKADFVGISFSDATFEYDGTAKEIAIEGNLPQNATVTYTSDVPGIENSAIDIGVYNISALIEAPNFNSLTLDAKLTINSVDDERFIKANGDTLFFQNALDENKLYAYNSSNIVKVSNDNAVDMVAYGDESIYYVSKSLVSSIKSSTYHTTTNEASYEQIINKNARYIQIENQNTIYYVENGLTNGKSGIYRLNLAGEEPVITCLSVGKAKYLQLVGDKLYFADGTNDYKLSFINTSDSEQTRNLLVDEKIKNLTYSEGSLYFTVNNLLGDYIAKYNISSKTFRKLTIDSGIDFVILDGYLYYLNVDIFTTTVVGTGIYRVNANPSVDNNSPGTKIIDGGEMGVCSLALYGIDLVYYDVDGYKLMKYSLSTGTTVNLLEGFVKPEDPAPTSFGSQIETANGIIYYLDIYDDKTLHSYNPLTKANIRLTSSKVDNFSIVGDYIYYNMVSYGILNDTYRMNYKLGGLPELINSNDSKELVSDGQFIYYVAGSAIHKADMDGQNDIIIFDYSADNLVLDNGTLYFCAKPTAVQTIMKIENVSSVKTPQEKVCVNDDYACDRFAISNGVIYFRHNYGLMYANHRLASINVDGTGYKEMVTKNTDPAEIIVHNGYVYYANRAETKLDYDLYRISINGVEGQEVKLTNGNYVSSICAEGENIYFVNYYLGGSIGDSHLYLVSVLGGIPEKITK